MLKINKYSLIKNAAVLGVATLSLYLIATSSSFSDGHIYGENNPVTVKGYKGSKTDSTAYTGQIARQLQHNSLKKIVSKGNPNDPTSNTLNKMMNYFENKDKAKTMAILDPKSSSKFPVKQKIVGEISTGSNLAGKADGRVQLSWPNNMTGADVIRSVSYTHLTLPTSR